MDKYEYKLRSEEIVKLIEEEKYAEAAGIADMIDWRRVKSITMLLKVAALYRVNRRNEDCRAVLQLAYDRYPTNRSVVYSLCEVSIELDDVVAAIEYYKEFVKLAPHDNGVLILRYRILEAQEASLEERIEILEELKRKDYQEEWLYELAYLYHRVGLATKCVEECDDIIIWFGDGPYVMKAMELKMLHTPLTPIQQKKYDIAKAQLAKSNYAEDGDYAQDDYADGTEESGYTQTDYANDNYTDEDSYAQGNYATEDGYADGNYTEETGYTAGNYADSNYANEDGYADDNYAEETGYTDGNYTEENGYASANYAEETGYTDSNYAEETGYADDNYAKETGYADGNYAEEAAYTDDNYGDGVEYTQETYAPQDNYDANNYESGRSVGSAYHDTDSIDMSQYNTINLQKVVAESMKELFPDDDMFAEEKAEIVQPESINQEKTTQVSAEESIEETKAEESSVEETEQETVHTGRVAQMLTGVLEVAPEPHTGAISKVFVPGGDARAIKQDTDIETLRGTTEESVQEEHARLEQNGENVYVYEEPEVPQEEVFQPMTGQMNLEEVLAEWEKMKQEKAKEQKEEVRKLVLQQTGKIFENFDNSIKSGILGELEEENTVAKEPVIRTETILEETDDSEVEELTEIEDTSETEELQEETPEFYEEMEAADIETDYISEEYGQEIINSEAITQVDSEQEVYEQEEIPEAAEEELYSEEEYIEDELLEEEGVIEETQSLMETQEIDMNTEEIGSLPDKIIEATDKETKGVKKEELREFTPEEQELFENFAVTKKIRKQIIFALDKMSLAAYTGNVIITGDAGLGTVRMAKNLIREYQAMDANFSGKVAKITGEKLNMRDLNEVFAKLGNGAIIIEKANGLTQDKLYEMSNLLNQDNLGLIVIMEDTRKEITRLLEKQAMIADYFNIRIDLMEMDNNALVAYAKNYALALEYSIDELGTLALYTRIANSQSGNHVVTKDEVRDIVDEAIWKSKKLNFKNFVDVLFAKRYDREDMIVLRERDFM